MDLTSPATIKELLQKYQAKPSKTLGQNFLVHRLTLNKIIEAADLQPTDTVLEIGPGLGTLTQELAKRAQKVIAIEKDRVMVGILQETLKDCTNVKIIQADALRHDLNLANYKLVANVPYYATSPIIRKFLEAKHQPESIILMIQKEVAQRICAKPPEMSILAVSVQFYATAKIISYVSKGCFVPVPNVDSAIIKIIPHKQELPVSAELFFKVVKAGFLQPRKQLANNLARALKKDKQEITSWLAENKLNPLQRAETLSIQDWVSLAKSFPVD